MIKVKNGKAIANISRKSMSANRTRNIIAIIAIMLTTIMFTTLLTLTNTIAYSFEQQVFRQVGGDMHGTFKYITKEQVEELRSDPLIVKSGSRLMVGMPEDAPFNKCHVEISYMDETYAKGGFCTLKEGHYPKEGSDEIACDTRILKLLKVDPKLGEKITLSYYIGQDLEKQIVTDTFTLSGWWEFDEVSPASQAIVPLSYVEQVLTNYTPVSEQDSTGTWSLDVYLKSTAHIGDDLSTIAQNHGYQTEDATQDNYIKTGVNWAYLGAQLSQKMDGGTIASLIVLFIVFMLTGYFIIYNIFQISVAGDIRFYGLLKTIGTTGKQIRNIIFREALYLSGIGIPLGLLVGFLCGNVLAPVVMATMSYKKTFVHANPAIFIFATIFSLLTVFISCRKPGKVAASVSPVEAVRYTEQASGKKNYKKGKGKVSMPKMALSNLGRNPKKTILVVLSLALATVLLQMTVGFAHGFDMNKFIKKFSVSDFIVGYAEYFQSNDTMAYGLQEQTLYDIKAQGEVAEGGCIYKYSMVESYVPEDRYRDMLLYRNSEEYVDSKISLMPRTEQEELIDINQFYGMDNYPLSKLQVLDGDITPLLNGTKNVMAAVYDLNDYDEVENWTHWAKVGDEVTIRYVDEWKSYDSRTGKEIQDADSIPPEFIQQEESKYHEETYKIVATVAVPNVMTYRYYCGSSFVLPTEQFKQDTGTEDILLYMFDTTEETNTGMNDFLKDYTENIDPTLDYESKQLYENQFYEFRNMFVLLGSALSTIIGVIGVLNFLNAVVTSIMTRRREFAMLQSIGMTGKQLKAMLIYEGLLYTGISIAFSFILSISMAPCMQKFLGDLLWFFTFRFTLLPIIFVTPVFILLGIIIPVITYHVAAKQSIVERLRDID